MKICPKCKRDLPFEMYCKSKNRHDGLDSWCKDCRKSYRERTKSRILERHKRRRTEVRSVLGDLKTPCEKCGETRPYLIQFHHINPSHKSFNVGGTQTYSDEVLLEERNKCVCLCANCHIEFHYLYGKSPEKPEDALREYLK